MKNIRNKIALMVFAVGLIASTSLQVYANGPGPANSLTLSFENLSEEFVFVDLLIEIDETDKNYTPLGFDNLRQWGFKPDAEIVRYEEDGFASFTFHYRGAKSDIKIDRHLSTSYKTQPIEYGYVKFCEGISHDKVLKTQYEDLLKNYRKIKLAFLDSEGNILLLSNESGLPETDVFTNFYGFQYNSATNATEYKTYTNYYMVLAAVVIVLFYMIFSVMIEVIIATFFGYRKKQLGIIAIVNLCTQLIMQIVFAFLPFPYFVSVTLLEILVYITEYKIYKKKLSGRTRLQIMAYTVTANTVSLILGLLIIYR